MNNSTNFELVCLKQNSSELYLNTVRELNLDISTIISLSLSIILTLISLVKIYVASKTLKRSDGRLEVS